MAGYRESWEMAEISVWCRKTFGQPYTRDIPNDRVRWRDQIYDGMVYFRDEADRTLFLLRWNS